MPVTTVNSFSNDTQAVVGVRVYIHDGTGWIDLGVIKDLTPDEENEEFRFEGARNGISETYGVIPLSFAIAYTLNSENPMDPDIRALHEGSAGAADPGGDGTSFVKSSQPTEGKMLIVHENAEESKPSEIVYHPLVSVRRNGRSGTPGEEASALGFAVEVLADEEYTVPVGVNAAGPSAPYGYTWIMPTDQLDAALTTASAVV